MASNAVAPSVTPPSPFEWPQDLIKSITNITRDTKGVVTCPLHGFSTQNEGVTFVMFKQVKGMIQINGMNALIQSVIDANTFTVNINTNNFFSYSSSGVVIVDSGLPPVQQAGFQYFNTPFQNIANQR